MRTAGAEIFIESEDSAIGPAEQVLRKTSTADCRRLVARPLDEPHAETVEYAGQDENLRGLNHPAERASVGHPSPRLRPQRLPHGGTKSVHTDHEYRSL